MFPELTTDRLFFRQFQDNDLGHVFEALSHPKVIPHYGVQYDTMEACKEQMTWFASLETQKTGRWWAICSKDNTTFYGGGGFNNWDHEHQKAEVGFWLLPAFWGRGYMQEGMRAICDYAFRHMGIHRIEGFVESNNINCKRAMEKLDFQLEGCMRDCEKKDGRFISLDIYASINPL